MEKETEKAGVQTWLKRAKPAQPQANVLYPHISPSTGGEVRKQGNFYRAKKHDPASRA